MFYLIMIGLTQVILRFKNDIEISDAATHLCCWKKKIAEYSLFFARLARFEIQL